MVHSFSGHIVHVPKSALQLAKCAAPYTHTHTHTHTPTVTLSGVERQTRYRPGRRRDDMSPADGSSTRGGSTSIRGRVRSPHISGGRPAAGSQRAYSLGWDRRTDGSRNRLLPPYDGGGGEGSLELVHTDSK